MFGYIKPYVPQLLVVEHELYKATYCGLCRTMGKTTGCFSRFSLNYDFVFLALMRMVVNKEEITLNNRTCIAHPFKKRLMVEINDTLKYSAKISTILTRLKLEDNVADSHGISKLFAKIAGVVSIFLKKTDENLKELEGEARSYIKELSDLEKENTDSIDTVADTFGKLLGSMSAHGYEGDTRDTMYKIGYHLGKWVYVIDAIDDMEKDIKKKSFNVIVNSFGNGLTNDDKALLYNAVTLELGAMSESIEKIDFTGYSEVEGIIKNIIYRGMLSETKRVLKFTNS